MSGKTKTMKPQRTCESYLDDETKPTRRRICGEPARVRVTIKADNGHAVDEYDCCSECAPWQEPLDGITVEPIEESKR